MPSISQIRWRCRRGMLELDLLLNAFIDTQYQSLTSEQCEQFEQLLDYPDQTLYEMLTGKIKPADERMSKLVQNINKTVRQ